MTNTTVTKSVLSRWTPIKSACKYFKCWENTYNYQHSHTEDEWKRFKRGIEGRENKININVIHSQGEPNICKRLRGIANILTVKT